MLRNLLPLAMIVFAACIGGSPASDDDKGDVGVSETQQFETTPAQLQLTCSERGGYTTSGGTSESMTWVRKYNVDSIICRDGKIEPPRQAAADLRNDCETWLMRYTYASSYCSSPDCG